MNAIVLERQHVLNDTGTKTAGPGRTRRSAVSAMIAGGVFTLVAATLAVGLIVNRSDRAPAPAAEPATNAAPAPAFPDVGVAPNTYAPGHSSGWHTHPGVHSAVVLSGTLTIYDNECHRTDVHAGETYLGGRDPHLVRNELAEPVQLVVTYVFAVASPLDHASVVAAPAGCGAR